MATAVVANQRVASVGRPPNLPVIEHPRSRLGDKKSINVTGSRRGDLITSGSARGLSPSARVAGEQEDHGVATENADNLPSLQQVKEKWGQRPKHNRMLTWPPVHEQKLGDKRAKSAKAKYILDAVSKNRYAPDQLYELIKDKVTTSYYGLRQSFRANDPLGQGDAPKAAMGRILFHVIGYIRPDEVNTLLERIGLHHQDPISFDSFIACFRDNETVKREWLSPATKLDMAVNTRLVNPEENLRQFAGRNLPDEYKTAPFANALIKQKCKHRNFNIRDHLAPSCFDIGGVILPPQLQECLASLGVSLDPWEMEKLWQRYDLEGAGAISSAWFFAQFGLDNRGHYCVRAQTAQPRSHRYSGSPLVLQISEETTEGAETPDVVVASSQGVPRQSTPNAEMPRVSSVDIISYLMRRLEQGFYSLLMGFEHFDQQNNGTITKAQFCTILHEYDLPLSFSEADALLERCGVRRKDGVLNYKDFLHKFMSRAENGIAHRIIMDPSHRFNTRGQTPKKVAGILSAVDVEAKLMELLHKDFLRLLGTFKILDKHGLNLITQKELRNTIDTVFTICLSDQQFKRILYETGVEADGLVTYPEFLAIFNQKRPVTAVTLKPSSPVYGRPSMTSPRQPPRQPSPRQQTAPELLVTQNQDVQTDPVTPPEYQIQWRRDALNAGLSPADGPVGLPGEYTKEGKKKNKMETRYRPVKELEDTIADFMTNKSFKAKEAYEKIDRKATGRLSKTQMHYWLQELGILLHPTELQMLWASLDIAKDGLVHYAELFDYFIHRSKKQNSVKNKTGPSRHIQANRPEYERPRMNPNTESDHFSTPAYDSLTSQIVGLIRHKVLKYWDDIKNVLRDLDPLGVGTISLPQFQNLCRQTGFNLSHGQLDRLCGHFDFNQNGQFHYLQFLQLFLENSKTKQSSTFHQIPMQPANQCVQHTPANSALIEMRKQLQNDWKSVRRAFKKADVLNEGRLPISDFCCVLEENKIHAKEEDLYQIFSELDSDMDGKIPYDDFLSRVAVT